MKKTDEKIYENNGNPPILACIQPAHRLILDVGFGNGANAKILSAAGHIIDGITLSPIEAEASRGVIRNIYIYNLEKGLPKEIIEKYDAVICSHVLEHIAYPEALLKDIHHCLKPGGILVVALPNVMNYKYRWQLMKGNFPSEETGIWDNTHLRWYTFDSSKKFFASHSFQVVKAWVAGDLPWLTVLKFINPTTRQKLFRGLTAISKGMFGVQLLYLLQKAPE